MKQRGNLLSIGQDIGRTPNPNKVIVQQIAESLRLTFLVEKEKTRSVCFANSGEVRSAFKQTFGQSQKDVKVITEAVATFAARCGEKLRQQQSCAHIVHVYLYTNRHRKDQP